MPRNTSVTLDEHFDEFVSEPIKQGRYQSVSEVVRSGLRKLENSEIKGQQPRAKLEAAENSPLTNLSALMNFLLPYTPNIAREMPGTTEHLQGTGRNLAIQS